MIGPLLQGFALLLLKLVSDVDASHAGQRAAAVIQYLLDNRNADAKPSEPACAGSSQIVKCPGGDVRGPV